MGFINRLIFSFFTILIIVFFFVYCFLADNMSADNISDDVCIGMIVVGADEQDTNQLSDESLAIDLDMGDEKNVSDIIEHNNNFIINYLLRFLERFPNVFLLSN